MQMQSQRADATVLAGKGSRKAAMLERCRPAQGSSCMWDLTGMTWKHTNFDQILWPSPPAFISGDVKQAASTAALPPVTPLPVERLHPRAHFQPCGAIWRCMAGTYACMQALAHQIQATLPDGLASLCVSPHIRSSQAWVFNLSGLHCCAMDAQVQS